MSRDDLHILLQTGIEAAQNGRPAVARALFDRVIARDPDHESAWLWKATVAETPEERRACLRRVLVINPENQQAGQALQELQRQSSAAARHRIEARTDVNEVNKVNEANERAALLATASPPRRAPIFPIVLLVFALVLMVTGAALILHAQRDTPAAPTANPSGQQDTARTATMSALRTPVDGSTATPADQIRILPARIEELPATWTPSPVMTPTNAPVTPAGQTRRVIEADMCIQCMTPVIEGAQ